MKKLLLFASLLTGCLTSSLRADTVVVFNEIMYHPATNEAESEWIELRNQMAVDVDISGWSIGGGIQYTFASNTIVRGGGFVVVAVSPTNLMAVTGLTNVLGPFAGRLSNNGNQLQLINNSGRVMDEINYGTDGDWPVAPDGSGFSLAKHDRDSASGPAENWVSSDQPGGTPGADNFPFFAAAVPDVQLFTVDSAWNYEASGTDLGADWRQPGYSDSGWGSGNGWFYTGSITNGEIRPLPTLFNTGINTNGSVLAAGALDPHYIITAAAQGTINTNAMVMANNAAWLGNDAGSSWIGVNNNGANNVAVGGYNYLTRFSTVGFGPGTVNISMVVAVDDNLTNVFLNGAPLGFASSGFAAYSSPFTIPSGSLLASNTLEFRAVNGGTAANPHGLRVVFTSSGFAALTNTPLAAGPNTYYFRKSFTYAGDPANTILRLNAIVDDGAVFYLNGVEVLRQNMPTGAVTYATSASTNVAGAAYSGLIPIPASSLVAGVNVLAVEVHQAAGDTSDILFGAELIATPMAPPPVTLAFNEFSASTNSEFWLELANYGTNAILMDGSVIYRDGNTNNNNEFVFPNDNLSLAPGAYLALTNTALAFHPVSGDKLYLYGPGKTRIYDAVVVKKAPRGRSPNGTGPYLLPDAPTPGAPNSFAFHNEIVINEIMYNHRGVPGTNGLPATGSPESWLELYNRGANSVDLTGWELDGGISYKFSNKTLAVGGYLVVAKDADYLRTLYPAIDIVGNFSQKLSGSSDTIILRDPSGNPANQVHYFGGGRWPEFAAGGGSSLELRDPLADNSKAEAWAASDEWRKIPWQTNTYRLVAAPSVSTPAPDTATGAPFLPFREFILGLLSGGEVWIDDVSVVQSPTNNPIQLIANGDFENGLTGWRLLGNHVHSRLETDPDNPANHVLHIVSTGPQEHMHNHIETTLANGRGITNGQVYEISYRARHIAGNNLLNTRLYWDRVPRTTILPVAALNGTPGAQNSRYATNIGPTFAQFGHQRVVPQAGEAVTVSVEAQDPQGVSSCEVWWSANGGAWSSASMTNQGGALYAGTIPGFPAATVVQFYVRAVDGLGAASTYPAAGPNAGALYKVNDNLAILSLAHNVRILLTPANTALLHASTNVMSNDNLPCTVIYDENHVYYDMQVRLKSSERGRNDPVRVGFHLQFNPEELFRGVHPVMLVDRSGGGSRQAQEEILIRHMILRAGNIPMTSADLCRVLAPQNAQNGPANFVPRFEDEFVETAYENGGQGLLYELELTYYPTNVNADGYKLPQPDLVQGVDISDLGNDKESYRYNFIIKNHRDVDDYSRFIANAKAWSLPAGAALDAQTRLTTDVDEWLRAYAMISLCGVGDMYTFGNNHNLLAYIRPSDQRVIYFPWDMDFSFSQAATAALIGTSPVNNFNKIITNSVVNLRLFYGHMLDHIGSSYNTSYMTYWVNRYKDYSPGSDYTADLTYIQQRSDFAKSTINGAGGNAGFGISGTNVVTTSNNLVTLTGTAPVQIKTIQINGVEYPITWTSLSTWIIRLPVFASSNSLQLVGYDVHGNPLTNVTPTVTINYTGPIESPQGKVVINEIMYNPVVTNATFVELLNASSQFTFDLTGWRINGLGYTFPAATFLAPGATLVLAKDAVAFASAYGATNSPFGFFNGNLQLDGETLTLLQPGGTNGPDVVISKVRYENTAPWPAGANGNGASLQLIDATQDPARVSNWSDGIGWRYVTLSGNFNNGTNVDIFMQAAGEVYIDDVTLVPAAGPYAGINVVTNGGFEAPLSVGPWLIPASMSNSSRTNSISHSGSYSLHVVATNGGNVIVGTVIKTFVPNVGSNICTLGFWYHTIDSTNFFVRTFPGSGINNSAGFSPKPLPSTPGASNLVASSLSAFPLLWINEVQPDNINGITDSASEHEPWLELYNAGTNTIALDGYTLANNFTNLGQWTFPAGTVITNGEFKVIFADGETNDATPTELHTSFRLSSGTGSIALSRPYNGAPQLLDYVKYSGVTPGRSYGSFPDGQPFDRQEFYYVTPGGPNNASVLVFINEWMASNTRTLADLSSGSPKYDDWFEIYNPGAATVNLSGYFLTDVLTNKFHYEIPPGYVIPPGGHLLVWADNEPNQNSTNSPDLHVNFQLSKSGEEIGLFAADGTQIDAVTFGAQTSDVSAGRCPDGTTNIISLPAATPRQANTCPPSNTAPVLAPIGNKFVHEGQTVTFTATATDSDLPAQILTYSLDAGAPAGAGITSGGLFTWSTIGVSAPSTHNVTVRVTDNGTPNLDNSRTISISVLTPLNFSTISRTGTQLTLGWEFAPGQTYQVVYKNELSDATWLPLNSEMTTSGNSLSVTVDVSAPSHRFYAVKIVE